MRKTGRKHDAAAAAAAALGVLSVMMTMLAQRATVAGTSSTLRLASKQTTNARGRQRRALPETMPEECRQCLGR